MFSLALLKAELNALLHYIQIFTIYITNTYARIEYPYGLV